MPTIDFTTFNEDTLRNFKPVLAKTVLPSWWKKMKIFQAIRGQRTQTIRACPAMHDWTKSGWYLLANRDIEVLVGSDRESLSDENFATRDPSGGSYASPTHPSDQFDNAFDYLKDNEFGHVKDAFKCRNPWNIITPKGYSCYYLDPFLFQNEFFATWQGIIDTDEFNVNQDNSQIIFYPKVNDSFTIPKGTPLCQIIPFKREEWVATYQLKSHKSYIENLSEYTSENENKTMAELSRQGFADELHKAGPYKRARVWTPKHKDFKEDITECPFDPKTGKLKPEYEDFRDGS